MPSFSHESVNRLMPRRKNVSTGKQAASSSTAMPSSTTPSRTMTSPGRRRRQDDAPASNGKADASNDVVATQSSSNDDRSGSGVNSDGDPSSSDSDSSRDDDDPTTAALSGSAVALSALPPNLDRASLAASLPRHVDTSGLSDYELLRLKNIQRNEAKLASLGLFGITSRNNRNNGGGTGGKGGAASGGRGVDGGGGMSERARKAADTRRRNAERARDMVQRHQRWLTENRSGAANDYGDSSNSNNGSDALNLSRLQPSRAAKSREVSYSTSPYAATPKRLQQFQSRLCELREFHSAYGGYDLLSRTFEGGKYRSLCEWTARQRTQYLKYKRGEKSTLDEGRVELLEGLAGDWWRKRENRRGGGVVPAAGRKGGADGDIARWLWKSEGDTEEDEIVAEEMRKEVDDRSTTTEEEDEVEIGTLDSYSNESIDDYDMSGAKGHPYEYHSESSVAGQSRPGRSHNEREQEAGSEPMRRAPNQRHYGVGVNIPIRKKRKRSNSPNRHQKKSSLEQIDGTQIENSEDSNSVMLVNIGEASRSRSSLGKRERRRRRRSSYSDEESILSMVLDDKDLMNQEARVGRGAERRKRKRSRNIVTAMGHWTEEGERRLRNDDHLRQRGRRRNPSSHSDDDESTLSMVIYDESMIRKKEETRRRRHTVGTTGSRRPEKASLQYQPNEPHRDCRERTSNRQSPSSRMAKKPMNEIVISPSRSALADRERSVEIRQRKRNEMMAEYGRLYGRRCWILERQARLEYELRAIQSYIAILGGSRCDGDVDGDKLIGHGGARNDIGMVNKLAMDVRML